VSVLADPLVGRALELASFEQALEGVDCGRSSAIELVGEAGIGKTRLLRELATRAEGRDHLVLAGSASDVEQNLPLAVFVDALDDYVRSLDPERLTALGDHVEAELAHVFPSLAALASGRRIALSHERYRSHRAVQALLELLAAEKPLVLVLDDFHWADSASTELLGALLHRPPAAAVLITVAMRQRKLPQGLASALERADRDGTLTRIRVGALTFAEAREFLGNARDPAEVAALYEESGGNPFYLEQLARALDHSDAEISAVADVSLAIGVPAPVVAALAEEVALLSPDTRIMIEGAAVAGDPFEPELAAAAAATPESSVLQAIDDLLRLDLVRSTDVPRRFRFRHPLVRRAVYEATPAGWRLSAHERCAEALAARGATAAARAHHVERSAREGDDAAVSLLRGAGDAAMRLAPASAAHWFATALRLLASTAPAEDRVELLLSYAGALTAAGQFSESHRALLEGLAIVPKESSALRSTLTTSCARLEHRLGHYEQAHARLLNSLDGLGESASREAVDLMIELALNELYRSKYESMYGWSERAVSAARQLGDPPLTAAALAMPALADAMTGARQEAQSHRAEAAALIDSLSDAQLQRRLDAATWLAAAELYVDLYADADAHASRALRLAHETGQGELFLVLHQILGRAWYVRGKLALATEVLDGAIDAARLLGHTQALVGNLFNRSVVALAVGDTDVALAFAQQSVDFGRDLDEGFIRAWAAVRLAEVLLETDQPESALELLLGSAGGEEQARIPGSWRSFCLGLLARCWVALDRPDDAKRAAAYAKSWASAVQLPLAAAWADRATATVRLSEGDASTAAILALGSAAGAEEVGAPIEAAVSRTLAGRALAEAGHDARAVEELRRAADELDVSGALRYRDEAERELGKLGHRTHRRTRPGKTGDVGIESLTERELQVARLVVERKTNPEIAAELFLSKKTVETHLRNIFRKMNVPSRVALARAVDGVEHGAGARRT